MTDRCEHTISLNRWPHGRRCDAEAQFIVELDGVAERVCLDCGTAFINERNAEISRLHANGWNMNRAADEIERRYVGPTAIPKKDPQ